MCVVISLKIIEVILGNNIANMSLLCLRNVLQNFLLKKCIMILTSNYEFQSILLSFYCLLLVLVSCNNNFQADTQDFLLKDAFISKIFLSKDNS